ncbi:hypothetical protein VNO77_34511 [Canavalia gladiata]|uniref:Uncharacterized protein n=1 Tax=Canavalia gladiata TaxID=3824 RepID=A0AAN9KF87_CANGL
MAWGKLGRLNGFSVCLNGSPGSVLTWQPGAVVCMLHGIMFDFQNLHVANQCGYSCTKEDHRKLSNAGTCTLFQQEEDQINSDNQGLNSKSGEEAPLSRNILCHVSLLLFKITQVDLPCPWFRSYFEFNILGLDVLHGVRANAGMHRAIMKCKNGAKIRGLNHDSVFTEESIKLQHPLLYTTCID